MPSRLPRIVALAAALALGWGAFHSAPAEAAKSHAEDKKNKKDKKDKDKGDPNGHDLGPFKKKDYPLAERLRPLTMPKNMGRVGVGLGIVPVGDTTALNLGVNFDYGVTNLVELGAATGFALSPAAGWSHALTLRGLYLAYDTRQFDMGVGLTVPLVLQSGAPFSVAVDLPGRYLLGNGLFLRFGQGAIPIGLAPAFSFAINGTGGAGYQVSAPFLLFADLNVFQLALAPTAGLTGFWETLGLDVGGQYSPSKDWDVGAQLNLSNVWKVEGSFAWSLGINGRYRF